jgi:hypothetical protein
MIKCHRDGHVWNDNCHAKCRNCGKSNKMNHIWEDGVCIRCGMEREV